MATTKVKFDVKDGLKEIIKDGGDPQDILKDLTKQIKEVQTEVEKEKIAEQKAAEQKKKKDMKIKEARAALSATIFAYFSALDIIKEPTKEETEEFKKTLDGYLDSFESVFSNANLKVITNENDIFNPFSFVQDFLKFF